MRSLLIFMTVMSLTLTGCYIQPPTNTERTTIEREYVPVHPHHDIHIEHHIPHNHRPHHDNHLDIHIEPRPHHRDNHLDIHIDGHH